MDMAVDFRVDPETIRNAAVAPTIPDVISRPFVRGQVSWYRLGLGL
jgi:hypothetical protein